MESKKFYLNENKALLAARILKRLNSLNVKGLDQRIRAQKIQYFAQSLEISPYYPYNLYIRGPYSPSFANDLHLIANSDEKVDSNKFASEEIEDKFLKLKELVDKRDSRELELMATLHWLKKVVRYTESRALRELRLLKKCTSREVNFAKQYLGEAGL